MNALKLLVFVNNFAKIHQVKNILMKRFLFLTSFIGSYICKCAPGYEKAPDGRNCYRTNRTFVLCLYINATFRIMILFRNFYSTCILFK